MPEDFAFWAGCLLVVLVVVDVELAVFLIEAGSKLWRRAAVRPADVLECRNVEFGFHAVTSPSSIHDWTVRCQLPCKLRQIPESAKSCALASNWSRVRLPSSAAMMKATVSSLSGSCVVVIILGCLGYFLAW